MEYKLVIVVRKDISIGKGKLAAQVAHAAVMGVEKTRGARQDWLSFWLNTGQAKVVLKVNKVEDLFEIERHARRLNLSAAIVSDSGLTQLPPGTITCLGIG